jgi:hypothetical protein
VPAVAGVARVTAAAADAAVADAVAAAGVGGVRPGAAGEGGGGRFEAERPPAPLDSAADAVAASVPTLVDTADTVATTAPL